MKPSFALVGPGRVGSALARILCETGHRLCGVVGRDERRAAQAAEWISPKPVVAASWADEGAVARIAAQAQVILVATPDAAIQDAATRLVAALEMRAACHTGEAERVALHTSGARRATELAPLKTWGYALGSVHPLESCPSPDAGLQRLRDANWGVEGEAAALGAARKIVESCGGRAFEIRPEMKALYHAAACVAANYAYVLLQVASNWFESAGVGKQGAAAASLALMRGAVANAEALGLPAALTGPIERGDVSTVTDHVRVLAEGAGGPEGLALYRLLGAEAVRIASAKGHLAPDVLAELDSQLREAP